MKSELKELKTNEAGLSDNEIIAQFLGLPLTKEEPKFTGGFKTVPSIRWRYDRSWDWLMPVVEIIETKGYDVRIEHITERHDGVDKRKDICSIQDRIGNDLVYVDDGLTKLESTYKAVVRFIREIHRAEG